MVPGYETQATKVVLTVEITAKRRNCLVRRLNLCDQAILMERTRRTCRHSSPAVASNAQRFFIFTSVDSEFTS